MVVLLSSKWKGMLKICENFSIFLSENEHLFSFIMSSKVQVMWSGKFHVWMDVRVYWILDQIYVLCFNVLRCQEINSSKFSG